MSIISISVEMQIPECYSLKKLKEMETSYSFEETVKKIKELADTGKKICLFNDVKWVKGAWYPYPTNFHSPQDHYIVATGIRDNL
jgi:hypothetical protein